MSVEKFIKSLEKLNKKAMRGPWEIEGFEGWDKEIRINSGYHYLLSVDYDDCQHKKHEASAELIVELRNTLPVVLKLLKAGEEMRRYPDGSPAILAAYDKWDAAVAELKKVVSDG